MSEKRKKESNSSLQDKWQVPVRKYIGIKDIQGKILILKTKNMNCQQMFTTKYYFFVILLCIIHTALFFPL